VPVYLTYFTAWVEEDGAPQFRDDIYGEDSVLEEALYPSPIPLSARK